MKRRTLDLIFAVGGMLVAVLIGVLGLVLQNQASFAKDYVHDQLSAQKITFTPAKFLTAEENNPCLKSYAGKPLASGAGAACYANHYIGVHVKAINEGKTDAQTSSQARAIDTQLKALPDPNSDAGKALATQSATLHGKATSLFQGETLRGLLLTSYGFSIFGDRAQAAADVCFALTLVLLLAALAGFVHATRKSSDHTILLANGVASETRVPVNA
jgi:hypothetical protein